MGTEQVVRQTVTGFAPLEVLRGGDGPPLVFLHGEEGQRGWLAHHQKLAQAFTVWAPTLPGLGASQRPDWVESVPDVAKVLLRALDSAGVANCILGGASLGAWIAAEMASMEPARFSGLVLAGAQGTATGEFDTPDIFLMSYRRYLSFGYASADAFSAMWDGELDDDALSQDLEIMELVARVAFKPYMHDRSLLSCLARFQNPAHLIWGEQDIITPLAVANRFSAALPNAQLLTLAHAGHYVHLEQADAFADSVIAFGAQLTTDQP